MTFLCVVIGKERKRVRLRKRRTKTERDNSRLHHAKYINISIWCLILPPLPLTRLALLPSSLGLSGPIQDKVMLLACVMNLPPDPKGACRALAHRHAGCVCSGKMTGSKAVLRNLGHICRHRHKVTLFFVPGINFLFP